MARDRKQQLAELDALSKEAVTRNWASKPDVLTSFGAAYGALGEFDTASSCYEKAIASEQGSTPLSTIEQLANVKLRAAMRHPRKAGPDKKEARQRGAATTAIARSAGG